MVVGKTVFPVFIFCVAVKELPQPSVIDFCCCAYFIINLDNFLFFNIAVIVRALLSQADAMQIKVPDFLIC